MDFILIPNILGSNTKSTILKDCYYSFLPFLANIILLFSLNSDFFFFLKKTLGY